MCITPESRANVPGMPQIGQNALARTGTADKSYRNEPLTSNNRGFPVICRRFSPGASTTKTKPKTKREKIHGDGKICGGIRVQTVGGQDRRVTCSICRTCCARPSFERCVMCSSLPRVNEEGAGLPSLEHGRTAEKKVQPTVCWNLISVRSRGSFVSGIFALCKHGKRQLSDVTTGATS